MVPRLRRNRWWSGVLVAEAMTVLQRVSTRKDWPRSDIWAGSFRLLQAIPKAIWFHFLSYLENSHARTIQEDDDRR